MLIAEDAKRHQRLFDRTLVTDEQNEQYNAHRKRTGNKQPGVALQHGDGQECEQHAGDE